MEDNLKIYSQIKEVPKEAQKKITGGRLKGMTDIKPMWRIEELTKLFGPCGIGWYTKTTNKEIIEGADGEKIAVVDILLFVKIDEQWSEGIEGSGGSGFVTKENKGLYTSDECFKMAYTDALSVACKSLGMGADVYWGDSKYNNQNEKDLKELTIEDAKNYTMTFGKYKGKKLSQVPDDYIDWLSDNDKLSEELCELWNLLHLENNNSVLGEPVYVEPKVEDEKVRLISELMNYETLGENLDIIKDTYKVKTINDMNTNQLTQTLRRLKEKYKKKNVPDEKNIATSSSNNDLPF